MGTTPHLSLCACITAPFGTELQVSMGSSPHLWFLHSKQRLLDPNNKSLLVPDITCRFVQAIQRDYHQNYLSLWVPTLICGFCMHNSDFWTRVHVFYGYKTSPVVLCMQNSALRFRITSLNLSQLSSVVFACKTGTLGPELQVSMVPWPHLCFVHSKEQIFHQKYKSLCYPDLICGFMNT